MRLIRDGTGIIFSISAKTAASISADTCSDTFNVSTTSGIRNRADATQDLCTEVCKSINQSRERDRVRMCPWKIAEDSIIALNPRINTFTRGDC